MHPTATGRRDAYPTRRLALHAAGGPGEAFEEFLGDDVIVGRKAHEIGLELGLEVLNGLLNFPVDEITRCPVLK